MSRIGRKPISVPPNVKVAIKDHTVTLSGPQGSLDVRFKPQVRVAWAESEKAIRVSVADGHAADPDTPALWGTTRALIQSAIVGVTKGYETSMEVVGVGWTAALMGDKLKLVVGYANPIIMQVPKGLKVTVDKQFVRLSGPDKQVVGQFAADMRAKRKPEPYNGKGVKYVSETIKRKQGKAFGTTA